MKERSIIRTYDDLLLALRKRREDLGMSTFDLEQESGLQSGYVTKIENAFTNNKSKSARFMGALSFELMLKGLGIGIAVIDNACVPKSARKHSSHSQRIRAKRRWENVDSARTSNLATKAAKIRSKILSPERRSEIAKKASVTRWAAKRAAEHERLAEIARKAGHSFPA